MTSAEAVLNVKASRGPRRPRPDPLPDARESYWTIHAPWVAAIVALGAAALLFERHELGLAAAGAAAMAVLGSVARGRRRQACQAAHLSMGLLIVALWHGPAAAGAFALPVGILLCAAMLARAAALQVLPAIAPLAGRLQWRFRGTYREAALRFGGCGLAASVLLAIVGNTIPLRVAAIALFPIALRTYTGTMLSRRTVQDIWSAAVGAQLLALLFFVPSYGATAAAWAIVLGETILFGGSALVMARRTGATPLSVLQLAVSTGAALLILGLAMPRAPKVGLALALAMAIGSVVYLFWQAKRES